MDTYSALICFCSVACLFAGWVIGWVFGTLERRGKQADAYCQGYTKGVDHAYSAVEEDRRREARERCELLLRACADGFLGKQEIIDREREAGK